jgi:hypothetical protein
VSGDELGCAEEAGASGSSAASTDDPDAQPAFAHWPVPVGQLKTRGELTFVHSSEPGGFSVEEFFRIPDERVELLDGVVVVRPDVTALERRLMDGLHQELCDRCPKGFVPMYGPLDVRVGPVTVFRPDIQVLSGEGADAPRMLVVEVMPDRDYWHRRADRQAKLHGYRDIGVGSYWAVDPDTSLVTVYEINYLKKGSYRCDEVCARGQRYWWRMWAQSSPLRARPL